MLQQPNREMWQFFLNSQNWVAKEGRSSQVPGLVLDKDAMRQMDFAVEKL
jgi:hypothetical protein